MGFAWLAVKAFSLCFAWLSLHVKKEERCGVSSYGDTIAFQGPPSGPSLSLTMFQRLQLNISHQQLELWCIFNTKFAILISMPNTFNIAVSSRLCVTCDMYLARRGMHGCFQGQAQWRERSARAKDTSSPWDQDGLGFGCLGVSSTPKFRGASEAMGSKFNNGAPVSKVSPFQGLPLTKLSWATQNQIRIMQN